MKQLPPPLTMEMLALFVQERLDAVESAKVLQLAIENPVVADAIDLLKRDFVAKVIAHTRETSPALLIESGDLEAYFTGDLTEKERTKVELARSIHPAVAEVFDALQDLDSRMNLVSSLSPRHPAKAKQRFLDFLDAQSESHDQRIIRPPFLNADSTPADYQPWLSQFGPSPEEDYANLFVQPIDANPDCLTLLVWVKNEIAVETHLDSIEKFLVLEGSCKIDVEGEIFILKAGDKLSIPKFKAHTVYVTSAIPCKLIVQQIAA